MRPLPPDPDSGGPAKLSPARPAVHGYRQSGAVTGPLYRHFPGRLKPSGDAPHLDGIWFLAVFPTGGVDTARLDSAGTRILAQGRLRNFALNRPVDFQEGPDGGLVRNLSARAGAAHSLESAGPPGVYLVEVAFPGGRRTGKTALTGL